MSIAVLKEIKDTEYEAGQIIAGAQQKAREITAAARNEASRAVNDAERQAECESEAIINKFKSKADEDIAKIELKTKNDCDTIIKSSEAKLEKAVEFIVRRIIEK